MKQLKRILNPDECRLLNCCTLCALNARGGWAIEFETRKTKSSTKYSGTQSIYTDSDAVGDDDNDNDGDEEEEEEEENDNYNDGAHVLAHDAQ